MPNSLLQLYYNLYYEVIGEPWSNILSCKQLLKHASRKLLCHEPMTAFLRYFAVSPSTQASWPRP